MKANRTRRDFLAVGGAAIGAALELSRLQDYNGDQITVEPRFSPDTTEERRAVYESEAAMVRAFEYADLPGHARVEVEGDSVVAKLYRGISQDLWKTVDLAGLMVA